ncbi:tetratricopeptide repeat protein [Fictibacillus aquaticus]|uniref:Uncharacterized protein n=1 Tax=Fictibacillus aquaticus TaxID=2021314 RepID=A0A235F4M5_9BACL|nr:tetratricopeptide repeat protein [Fictibacillus aquaticus]OYD56209.1 hypothetical protein CGZ90_18700 [Fictibacillus aquaticus]
MEKQKEASRIRGRVLPFLQDGDYFFKRGIKAYHKKDLNKARKMFERAVFFQPEEPAFLCQLASVLAELGEYELSNDYLHEALAYTEEEMAECYYFMANNYAHLGLFSEAEQYALLYMENEPDGEFFDDSQELLDLIHFESDDKDISQLLVEEDDLILKHDEAKRSIERGELVLAKEQLNDIIENHPTFWAAYNNLALTHFYKSEYEEALSVLQSVLEKNPGNLNALCNMAIFLSQLGMKENGRVLLNRLKGVHPIHPDHRYKLGNTFGLLEEHEYANRWLLALKKTPLMHDPVVNHALAVSFYALGKPNLALKYWKRTADIDPDGKVVPHYLTKLEEGTLSVSGSDYQYRVPKPSIPKKLPENRKMTSMIERFKQIRKSLEKNKLAHLFLLRGNKNEESYELLQDVCKREDEPLFLKEIAAAIMLEHDPATSVILVHGGNTAEISSPSPVLSSGMDIIQCLKENGTSIDEDVMFYWLETVRFAKEEEKKILHNTAGAAAAIDYMARKHKGKTSQKAISELYGVSVSVLSSRVKKVSEWLGRSI